MRTALFVAFLLVPFSSPVLAQDVPLVDLSGGYSFLKQPDTNERHGWYATGAVNLTGWFAVAAEVGANYQEFQRFPAGRDTAAEVLFALGGRVAARGNPRVTPFAQFLVGNGRRGISNFHSSHLALQPGGGVDVWVARHVAVRTGLDWRYLYFEDLDGGWSMWRVYLGMAVGLGTR